MEPLSRLCVAARRCIAHLPGSRLRKCPPRQDSRHDWIVCHRRTGTVAESPKRLHKVQKHLNNVKISRERPSRLGVAARYCAVRWAFVPPLVFDQSKSLLKTVYQSYFINICCALGAKAVFRQFPHDELQGGCTFTNQGLRS